MESAIEKGFVIVALFSTLFLAYPETTVLAHGLQTSNGKTAQVFDINSKSKKNPVQENLFHTSINIAEIVTVNGLLAPDLHDYLSAKGSPLAQYAANIPNYNNWKRALAISFVESNMCKRTPKLRTAGGIRESYNCSGIANGKRVYNNYEEWFADMNNLLNKPAYVNRPIERFLGFYVVPGSANWLYGVRKVEAELTALENQAKSEHLAITTGFMNIAGTGTVELAVK